MNYAVIELKKKQINDYMSSIDYDSESISVGQMKNDLHRILGEKPGVELKYKSDSMIVEGDKKVRKLGKLESVTIFFTYEDNDGPHFDRISYLV